MTRHNLSVFLFGALLLTAVSIGPSANAQDVPPDGAAGFALVGTYPLPEETFGGQIVFYFNRPLAPVDDPATLIRLSPPLEGTWRQMPQSVVFDVAQKKRGPGWYEATFLPALQDGQGNPPAAPDSSLLFTDFALQLENVEYGRIAVQSVNIQLTFNAPVPSDQVRQHLTITDANGTVLDHTLLRRNATNKHLVSVPALETTPYTVTLSPGITENTGRFETREQTTRVLPALGGFTISDVIWRHWNPDTDQISLKPSYPVAHEQFLEHFEVYPDSAAEPLTLERAESNEKDRLLFQFKRPAEPYKTLRYVLRPGMTQVPAVYAQATRQGTLTLKREPLRIEYHNWDSEGVEPIRLQLYFDGQVDASELNKHLSVSPAVQNLVAMPGKYGGVDLTGDWDFSQQYGITITPGLRDQADRREVLENITWQAGNPPQLGGVGFAYQEPYYFPRRAAGPLKLYGRNLKEADVTLYQLFPSNLVQALNDMDGGKSSGSFGHNFSRKVAETKVKFPESNGERVEVPLPLEDFMPPGLKGIFGLNVAPAYDYYNTKVLVWTDIGVLAHWQEDQILVYTHNLWDLAPLSGAKVTLYSDKHQRMGEATTGDGGVAQLSGWDTELGRPRVVIVETADDFTFLPLNQRGEDPVAFTNSMADYNADGYDAFLYADRNLYRPGEPIHLRWLVRQADGSPLTGAPFKLRVVDPKEGAKEFTSELSAWGSGTQDIETDRTWLTGIYRLELWVPGAETALTTQDINIEDFVPNRITVEVSSTTDHWLPGATHPITILGEQLSGGPARERKTGAAVILSKAPWQPGQWPDFTFSNDENFNGDVRDLGEGQTDGLGKAEFQFTWQPPKDTSFPVKATIRGEVFELGGRSVAARDDAYLFPATSILGLAVANGAAPNTVDVAVAAVQPDGSAAAVDSATVTLEKRQWSYYVRRYSSHNEANWNEDYVTLRSESVALSSGKGAVAMPVPDGYGTYRVRVHRDGSPQYATQTFWSYRGQARLADASRPSLIKLEADKKNYNIGDTATVRVESPFDGNAIVVLQGANIERAITVPISGGAGTLTLPLEARHVPNLWLEATVIHPVEPGEALSHPYASFAMLNLPVHDPAKALTVDFLDLPEEIRPMTQLDVAIQVNGPEGTPVASEVTLALVDEGIHQILQYKNPDPVAWFQRDRRPDYRRAHYYDQVAYDFEAAKIGGGELLRKRLGEDDATVDESWLKPLALWSGTVETGPDGAASVTMQIPEFAGKVRLVAVATTGSEAGSQAANITIRRPVVLQTTLPRFVAPEDSFQITAVIENKKEATVKTTLKVEAEAPLSMDAFEQSWDLAGHAETVVRIPVTADVLTGSGTLRWTMATVDASGQPVDEYSTETILKVQAPRIYQGRSENLVLQPGAQQELVNTAFVENSLLTEKLFVTPNPMLRLRDALDYVIGYPYGCAEQTTSRCMPLYLLGQAASKTGNDWEAERFKQFIQAGIDRLFAMQGASGGIGYWPGARTPYYYGSIYAGHFLALAKTDPAFNVPEPQFQKLMKFIRERVPLDPSEGQDSLYNYSYACYVRALAQDATVMEDISSLDTISVSTAARQWLALATLTFTGAQDEVQRYLLNHPSAPNDERQQGGALNSSVRNDAITLMVQMAVGMEAAAIHPQADKLMRYLESHRYSTQEAAFLVSALSEYLKQYVGDVSEARASITAPEGTEERNGNFEFKASHSGAGGGYRIVNSGTAPLYVYYAAEGILQHPEVDAASNGITLTRQLEGKGGKVMPNTLQHGENYLVEIEIRCDEDFENVVLADILPGGLEIENPRLDGDAMTAWKKQGGVLPSFLEMRDDRLIAAFDRLNQGTHKFYYAVRAVTAGTFRQPGANAECMYEVQFNGRTASGEVTIAPPQ